MYGTHHRKPRSVPRVYLTCLRELITRGSTTKTLLSATGILPLHESSLSRFPSATSPLTHPLPLGLTFLSFMASPVLNAYACFLLTLLTRRFVLAPALLLLHC